MSMSQRSSYAGNETNKSADTGFNLSTQAGWATPRAEDAETTGMSGRRLAEGKTPDNLPSQATLLASWATPSNGDYRTPPHRTYAERSGTTRGERLEAQTAHLIPGASLNGSPAATAGRGLLAPHFSLWLMGLPDEWLFHAPADSPAAILRGRKIAKT